MFSTTMKLFKIKSIKTYVIYITTFVISHNMHAQNERKWHLQKTLHNIHLKTSLFEVKLYFINIMILFYQESQEIWNHEEHAVMRRKPR